MFDDIQGDNRIKLQRLKMPGQFMGVSLHQVIVGIQPFGFLKIGQITFEASRVWNA